MCTNGGRDPVSRASRFPSNGKIYDRFLFEVGRDMFIEREFGCAVRAFTVVLFVCARRLSVSGLARFLGRSRLTLKHAGHTQPCTMREVAWIMCNFG